MNTILEHLTYLILLFCLGAFLFLTSAVVLIAEEGVKLIAVTTLRIVAAARTLAAKHLVARSLPAYRIH